MGIGLNVFTGQLQFVGGASKPTSQANITALGDWGSPVSGQYSLTILASTHGMGPNPIVEVLEDMTTHFEVVIPDMIKINASGDVTVVVPETPDLRFLGKVLIR
jgi:hypothetical protein